MLTRLQGLARYQLPWQSVAMSERPIFAAIRRSSELQWLRQCRDTNKEKNPAIFEAADARVREVEMAAALGLRLGGATIDSRVAEAVRVYRIFLRAKHGRTQAAGYTERDIKKLGALQAVIKTVHSGKVTEGLRALQACGRLDCSYEQIAIDFAADMPEGVAEQARATLAGLEDGAAQ